MRNKKILGALLAVTTLATFGLAGCGDSGSNGAASKEDDKTITVAASPTPHAEILNKAVKPLVEKDGYKLEVKEFTDYVQPNTATEDGEVDANYFQHKPYLDNFNKEKGTHLVSVEGVHFEPFGLYPGKTKDLQNLQDGATVAVPNDATNEARALLLLQDAGLIKLKDPKDINATPKDVTSNPKNLKFKELEAAVVPTVIKDVDIAALNGNYAIQAGFDPTKDNTGHRKGRRPGRENLPEHPRGEGRQREHRQDQGAQEGFEVRRGARLHQQELQGRCGAGLLRPASAAKNSMPQVILPCGILIMEHQ